MSRILFARCVAYAYRLELAAVLVLSLLVTSIASAAEVTLTCTPPTKFTDGSNITGAITYTAHHGASASVLSDTTNLGSTCGGKITVADPPAGQSVTRYYAVRAWVNGEQSELSNVVSKTITTPKPIPNPPTGLAVVEGAQTAYVIKQTTGNISVVAVGQVHAGTACSTTDAVIADGKTYYVIPKESVSWAGSVRSELVLAQCS